jgi:hypothetical protein
VRTEKICPGGQVVCTGVVETVPPPPPPEECDPPPLPPDPPEMVTPSAITNVGTVSAVDTFPTLSVTEMVQFEYVPKASVLKKMVLFPA